MSPGATDEQAAAAAVLPVGFRFRPTDEELVRHYLKAKIAGRAHPDLLAIPDVDLGAVEPWDLPARSVIKSDDPEWFFFAQRERPRYPGKAARSSRSTAAGYWKATGKDRLIRSSPGRGGALIGIKKTLVFHRGRAPRGLRTAWIMHEYRATEPSFESGQNGSFVLYRLFNKHDEGSNSESPSTSSPTNHLLHGDDTGSASPSDLSQLTATKIDTHHLLAPASDTEQTAAQEAAFLDALTQLPDLQAEQRPYDGFPTMGSPMRPYTDHPFVGNMGEHDYLELDSITAEQDMLLNTAYDQTDDESCSWVTYPQHLLEAKEASRSDLINPNASFGEEEGWQAAPVSMQESTVSQLMDTQQGSAARRIRLVRAVERASQAVLTCHLESEDEAESCCSTESCSSDSNHDDDEGHVDLVGSRTTAGDPMHIQGRVHSIPTQLVSTVEVTDKLQHLSFDDHMLEPHAKPPPRVAGLTQRRLTQDLARNAHKEEGLLRNGDPVPEESSSETPRRAFLIVRSLWMALLLLVLAAVWTCLDLYKLV